MEGNAFEKSDGRTRPHRYAKHCGRVAVGLSGGVDSAVAAALLKKAGYDVVAVHLYCYDEGPYCTANEDRVMAIRVANYLKIPILIWDLRKEYKDKVMRYFFDEYKAGRTPNPDIVCNREIKFGIFLDRALRELKVDYVATGHYARIAKSSEFIVHSKNKDKRQMGSSTNYELRTKAAKPRYLLLRGVDNTKDQSYFLYTLTQKQLEHILFPIGNYRKEEVRKLAKKLKLPNAGRPDSQGICFIGPVPVSKFLREKLPVKKGPVVDINGRIIGEHEGVWFYTEGQRHGFKIFDQDGLPLYVVTKDASTNTLIVGRGKASQVKEFIVEKPHWIGELEGIKTKGKRQKAKSEMMQVRVRIRHLGEIVPAVISQITQSPNYLVTLVTPLRGVAPGQSAVFYGSASSPQAEEVLGGGVIGEIQNQS